MLKKLINMLPEIEKAPIDYVYNTTFFKKRYYQFNGTPVEACVIHMKYQFSEKGAFAKWIKESDLAREEEPDASSYAIGG